MDKIKTEDVELLCVLIEEYSKNSIFQLSEYGDVSKMHTKLKKISDGSEKVESIELAELVYLINMMQIASTRHKTPIQSWEKILNLYKHLIEVAKEVDQSQKNDSPKIEEIENLDVSDVPK